MIPVKNSDRVGLRHVMTKQEADKVLEILQEQKKVYDLEVFREGLPKLIDKAKIVGAHGIAGILIDTYHLRKNKSLDFEDQNILDASLDYAVSEISSASGQSCEEIKRQIKNIFS